MSNSPPASISPGAQGFQQQAIEPFAFADFSGTSTTNANGRTITIYCWSSTAKDSPQWAEAEQLGRLAARHGFNIITGGYCGSMEAVSKGAREEKERAIRGRALLEGGLGRRASGTGDCGNSEAADVSVTGILLPGQFPERQLSGNQYLTHSVDACSLPHRLALLSCQSRYFIALPGTMGTLTELMIIWSLSLLHPSDRPKPLIICYRHPWQECLQGIAKTLSITNQLNLIKFVDDADEAINTVLEDYKSLHNQN